MLLLFPQLVWQLVWQLGGCGKKRSPQGIKPHPPTFVPDSTAATWNRLVSQGSSHREKEGARHCCWEELTPFASVPNTVSIWGSSASLFTLCSPMAGTEGPSPKLSHMCLSSSGLSLSFSPPPAAPRAACPFSSYETLISNVASLVNTSWTPTLYSFDS